MSDSGRDSGMAARHPVIVAFDKFREVRPAAFDGTAEGRYLANRLQDAFQAGWTACEQTVKDAMDGKR